MDWSLAWKFKFAYLKLYSLILNLEDLLKDVAQNAQSFTTKRASERSSLIQTTFMTGSCQAQVQLLKILIGA